MRRLSSNWRSLNPRLASWKVKVGFQLNLLRRPKNCLLKDKSKSMQIRWKALSHLRQWPRRNQSVPTKRVLSQRGKPNSSTSIRPSMTQSSKPTLKNIQCAKNAMRLFSTSNLINVISQSSTALFPKFTLAPTPIAALSSTTRASFEGIKSLTLVRNPTSVTFAKRCLV